MGIKHIPYSLTLRKTMESQMVFCILEGRMTQLSPCHWNIKTQEAKNNIHRQALNAFFPPWPQTYVVFTRMESHTPCTVCLLSSQLLVCGFCSVTVFHSSNFVPLTDLPRVGYEALGFCAKGMPLLLSVENKACRFALLPPDAILLQEKRAALRCTGLSRDWKCPQILNTLWNCLRCTLLFNYSTANQCENCDSI